MEWIYPPYLSIFLTLDIRLFPIFAATNCLRPASWCSSVRFPRVWSPRWYCWASGWICLRLNDHLPNGFQSSRMNLHSHQLQEGILFLCLLTNTWHLIDWIFFANLVGPKCCDIMSLIYISLVTGDIKSIFLCLSSTHVSSLMTLNFETCEYITCSNIYINIYQYISIYLYRDIDINIYISI